MPVKEAIKSNQEQFVYNEICIFSIAIDDETKLKKKM